jgi:type IV pilus assembly protein PilY1
VRPNVLFILDTSGSMSGMDGMSEDRLDRMKDALHTILDDANNINVGLMRFTDPGGPILFPVSYIDEDVSVVMAGAAAVDVLNGNAVQNWDGVGTDSNLTKSDRTYSLGSGIPSQAVPILQPEGITLLIGGGGGATSVNPNIALPRVRTYWNQ